MRTEMARVQTEAQKQSFERNGYDEYIFLALGSACEVCKNINEKHFKVKDMKPGENAPPMHPNCRCSTAAWVDEEEFEELVERGADEKIDYTARRKERLARRKEQEQGLNSEEKIDNVTEKHGNEIDFDFKGKEQKFTDARLLIENLASEYDTRLRNVTTGAQKAAGDVDITGQKMRINTNALHTAIHEFAHTIANSYAQKIGLTNNADFWKEIRKIRREYHKAVDRTADTNRWISSYEHSNKSVDEFFAEAFTHAKMKQMGLEIPDRYGKNFTYSDKVLKTVDKHFKNGFVENKKISSIIDEGIRFKSMDSKDFETIFLPKDEYAHVMHELNTHASDEQRAMRIFTKPIVIIFTL